MVQEPPTPQDVHRALPWDSGMGHVCSAHVSPFFKACSVLPFGSLLLLLVRVQLGHHSNLSKLRVTTSARSKLADLTTPERKT